MNKLKTFLFGVITGLINSLFGAGGGLIAVSTFKNLGLSQQKAQSSAIAVMLPLSFLSAIVYALKGYYNIGDALHYLPFGLVGAFLGTKLLGKIPDKALKKIFAVFLIYTGIRMFMR